MKYGGEVGEEEDILATPNLYLYFFFFFFFRYILVEMKTTITFCLCQVRATRRI
jgi:hypothetical protein